MVMGGVVFSGPSLQSALVRRTCQRSVGSRLLRNRRPYAAKCRAFFRGSLRPLRFARALVFDCAASLRKLRFTTAHFASRATPSPAHPAAPLGSRAAKRRPVSFAHESESQNAMQPARSFRAGFSRSICKELCSWNSS